jgi:cellobiose-specific phosphotransferase system component IIA
MKKLSEILPGLLAVLQIVPGGKLEQAVAEALAEAHDAGIDAASENHKQVIADLRESHNQHTGELRADNSAVYSDLLDARKQLRETKEKLDLAESEYVRIESVNKGLVVRLKNVMDEKEGSTRKLKDDCITYEGEIYNLKQEVKRLHDVIRFKDDTIAKLYNGDVFMVQVTDRMRPYDWKTLACFTSWDAAMHWGREMGVRPRDEVTRVVSMKLNPELPGHD